jgi:hypothetical protein
MTDYKEPDDKPKQPPAEKKCESTCEPAYPDKPTYTPPKKCKPACECPPGTGTTDNCLEDLIDAQTKPITDGDWAKAFKAELEAFLAKARTAKDEYTPEKYQKLVKQWEDQDRDIAELLRKLVCALPCWRCVIECHVCPLLYQMRDAELQLNGNGTWCSEVHNLQDLLYWQTRDKEAKERFFNRLKALLAAWEKPAQTIEKTLTDNAKLIVEANKQLGTEPSKVLVDVFLRLIPAHLAIAPAGASTKIEKKFSELCCCDDREPLKCCGIDIGERSFRQRLIGPLPYLIDPNGYFNLICCLISCAYQPAKDKLSAAEAAVASTENTIKRLKGLIDNGLKNFDKNAKAAIPVAIDCKDYKEKDKGEDKEPCNDKDNDKDNDNYSPSQK